jgi:putative hydrolase of the HAD superfamily
VVATLLQGVGAVVFDAVGTLIHPEPAAPQVYAEVGRRFGSRLTPAEIAPRFAAAFQREEAYDREQAWRIDEAREAERWRHIVARVLDDVADADGCFQELFAHFARPEAWRCSMDAATTLETLARKGYQLAMASNYDRRLRCVTEGLPALRPIKHLVISSEVGWRKPSPRFFTAVSRTIGCQAEHTLHVGDDPANDYEGARAAGMRACLLAPRKRKDDKAVVRIERLNDLLEPVA